MIGVNDLRGRTVVQKISRSCACLPGMQLQPRPAGPVPVAQTQRFRMLFKHNPPTYQEGPSKYSHYSQVQNPQPVEAQCLALQDSQGTSKGPKPGTSSEGRSFVWAQASNSSTVTTCSAQRHASQSFSKKIKKQSVLTYCCRTALRRRPTPS